MANRVNLGKVAFLYKGAYSSATTYERLDYVTDGGSTYFSKKDGNTGNALPASPADGTTDEWWGVLAYGADSALEGVVYKDNCSLGVSPSVVEKGVSASVTLTVTANRSLAWNTSTPVEKYAASGISVKNSAGSAVTATASGTNGNGYAYVKVTNAGAAETYTVACTVNGEAKSLTGKVNAYYPKYYGSSALSAMTSGGVLALTKQSISSTAVQSGVSVKVTAGQYLWLCVPSGMKISLVKDANTNIEVAMLSYTATTVTVSGKGTYNCYRSQNTMNNTETLKLNIS